MSTLRICLVAILCLVSSTLLAHSGGLDAAGGHNDNIHGGYHYHRASASFAVPLYDMSSLGYKPDAKQSAKTEARKKARKSARAARLDAAQERREELEEKKQPPRYKFHFVKESPSYLLDFEDDEKFWTGLNVYSQPVSHLKDRVARIEPLKSKEDFRTWVNKTGAYSVIAALVSVDNGTVKLRRLDGSVIALAESELSELDQRFLQARFDSKDT